MRKPRGSYRRLLPAFVLAELDSLIASGGGVAEELKSLQGVAHGSYDPVSFGNTDMAAALKG